MDLKLGHHSRDGIEVVDVEGEIDISTAPRLRELLIDLVSQGNYQLVVNLDKVQFLDSTVHRDELAAFRRPAVYGADALGVVRRIAHP